MRRLLYIWILCVWFLPMQAQEVLKVVAKVTEKEYRFNEEFLLEINAEKADINIHFTSGKAIKLKVQQVVKNSSLRQAERELSYLHFVDKKERQRLYLHNYVQIPAGMARLSSIVNNIYTIEVPLDSHLKISNELGTVRVVGASKTSRFNLNYCGLKLEEVKGKVYIDSRIGDVSLHDCAVDGELLLDNVVLKMQNSGGSYDITAKFGQMSCLLSEQVSLFNVSAEQCDVTLINRNVLPFDYAVKVSSARINALDEVLSDEIEKQEGIMTLMQKAESAVGTVIIKSEYGDVNLY